MNMNMFSVCHVNINNPERNVELNIWMELDIRVRHWCALTLTLSYSPTRQSVTEITDSMSAVDQILSYDFDSDGEFTVCLASQ
jgi:hypothetical protein